MTTDVRAIRFVVIKSSHFGFLWDGDDGGAFEARGDFAQLQWFVEDLCEDGGQLVSTGFEADWCHTVWAWCLPSLLLSEDLVQVVFTYLQCRCGGEGVAGGVNGVQIVCQLLILHSAGGWWWCLSYLSTLKQNHWKMICSLVCQNNSSLTLWSPFPVCIWPVYTRLYPPFCKHLLWPDRAVWVLQWTMVCRCCRLNEFW